MKKSRPARTLRDVGYDTYTMPSLHADLTSRLASISDTPALDASVLLAHIVDKPRTWVMAHSELTLTSEQQHQLATSLTRLERGESFPYVLGHWEFFGLELDITPNVLIPRPETELLVEKAVAWLQSHPEQRNVADIGTGSGAIAISVAVNAPQVNILATDISSKALQVAKRNAEKHGVSKRIEFAECDLLPDSRPQTADHLSSTVGGQRSFDLICANLPYIPLAVLQSLPIYQREPTVALDGGEDGLDIFRKLLNMIPNWLAPQALILLEVESSRGAQTLERARSAFHTAKIVLQKDLTGRDRLLEIQV